MPKNALLSVLFIIVTGLSSSYCGNDNQKHHASNITPIPQVEIPPEVALPAGYRKADIVISESAIAAPAFIDEHSVPIGKVYDIELANDPHVVFSGGKAIIRYSYDKEKLKSAGLIEQFMVYYFDDGDSTWKQVDEVSINTETSEVVAYTSHFTPFVLTALTDPWILVGGYINNPSFSLLPTSYEFCFDGTTPYIAWYENADRNGYKHPRIFVKYWNGTNWILVGGDILEKYLYESHSSELDLAVINGKPTVGFITNNNGIRIVQWDGVEWKQLGKSIDNYPDRSFVSSLELVVNGNTLYLTWKESVNQKSFIHASFYENNQWTALGDILNEPDKEIVSAGTPVLAFNNNIPHVAYIQDMHSIIIKSWDGTGWRRLHSVSTQDEKFRIESGISFTFHESKPYLAWTERKERETDTYGDWMQERVYCAYFDAREWKKLGNSLNSDYNDYAFTPSLIFIKSKPHIAYCDFAHDGNMKVYVKSWNGTNWELLGDSLNVENHYAWNPIIGYNGFTFFVAFMQDTEERNFLYVKAGNWNEALIDPALSQPQITKFFRTSSILTNSRTITLEADGYDDKKITHWMITGTDVKPLPTNFNWQSEKPTDCDMLGSTPGKYSLYLWAKDEDGNISDVYPPITVEIYGIALESASRQSHGLGYFGDQGRGLAKNDYPNFSPIAEGSDFAYDEALDNSDGTGFSLYDTDAFDYTAGTGFRIIENGENVAAEEGLHLTPLAKNLATIQSPPENQVYIDPLRGVFVLPRPLYWSRLESFENFINAEIPYGTCTTTFTQVGVHPGEEIMQGIADNGLGILYNYPIWNDSRGVRVFTISNNNDPGYTSGTISFWTRLDSDVSGWQRERERTYARCSVSAGSPELFRFVLQTTSKETFDGYIVIDGREEARKEIHPINSFEHVYLIWSRVNPQALTRIMVYINGVREFSIDTPSAALLIHDYKLELEGATHMSYQYIGSQTNIAAVGMSSVTVDNLKIWNHVVGDPGNHSRWLYEYEQTIGDDALHAIYSRENGYRPVLDSDKNSGVGYYSINYEK